MHAARLAKMAAIIYSLLAISGAAAILYATFTPTIVCRGSIACSCSLFCTAIYYMGEKYSPPLNTRLYIVPITYSVLITVYAAYAVLAFSKNTYVWRFAVGASATGLIGGSVLKAVYSTIYRELVRVVPKPVVKTALLTIHYQLGLIEKTRAWTLLSLGVFLLVLSAIVGIVGINLAEKSENKRLTAN